MSARKRFRATRAGLIAALSLCLLATGCSAVQNAQHALSRGAHSAPAESGDSDSSSDSRGSATGDAEIEAPSDLCSDGSEARELILAGASGPHDFTGRIVEPRGAEYDVLATVSDDGCTITGSVEYVELGCSGVWTPVRVEDVSEPNGGPQGLRVDFEERIVDDPDRACASDARVTLVWGPAGMFYFSDWELADGRSTDSRTHLDLVG